MSLKDYQDASPPPTGSKTVLLFGAEWHEASAPGGAMDTVLQVLAESNTALQFGRVNAEDNPVLCKKYGVTAVPTFVLLTEAGTVLDRIQGGEDVSAVTTAVQKLKEAPAVAASAAGTDGTEAAAAAAAKSEEDILKARLERLITSHPVMLFMKGSPGNARCGFSRQVVELLEEEKIAFGSFDILSDESVRQGLKSYSNWPTYPQVYVKGQLIGGLDILKEMKSEGSLREQFGLPAAQEVQAPTTAAAAAAPATLEDRLKQLIHRSRVMLFMKGLPSAPRCGFSKQMVELLNSEEVPYDTFDILTDEEVRQGLKTYSNWPTYPQLYVDGELVGGLDIVKEMEVDGSLTELLQGTNK